VVVQFVNSLTDSRVDDDQYSVLQSDCSSNLSFINFNMCSSRTIDDSHYDDLIP
jgi:hypothetical protein